MVLKGSFNKQGQPHLRERHAELRCVEVQHSDCPIARARQQPCAVRRPSYVRHAVPAQETHRPDNPDTGQRHLCLGHLRRGSHADCDLLSYLACLGGKYEVVASAAHLNTFVAMALGRAQASCQMAIFWSWLPVAITIMGLPATVPCP